MVKTTKLVKKRERRKKKMSKEFFDLYFEYAGVGRSESPAVFHRWAIIGCVGTMLGRQVRIPFGHGQI